MNKSQLSETDIRTKFITPAIVKAGWDKMSQIREEVSFTAGKIFVKSKRVARGEPKRADYILYYKPNIPVAVVEAKDNNHSVGAGIQQALNYAKTLDIPCVFSSNGDGFLFHDRTATDINIETELSNDEFPTPAELWEKYKKYKDIATLESEKVASQEYYLDGTGRSPRYYQQIAINRAVEAIANGQNRILLVMATGTGKTYVAFQIIHRLWKSGAKKRILFLADRKALIDQTKRGDFKHFKEKMTVVKHRQIDKSYEVYLALYQGLSGNNEEANAYKQFSRDFFDLIVIDECHRGSAREDSNWHEILQYFNRATHIGLTATPKETNEISNIEYFGDPIYIYSLKQGIDDGFLAPYRVIRVTLDVDAEGWRPEQGKTDIEGNEVEDRIYNRKDFDKNLVIEERTNIVTKKLTEFLKGYDRFAKTIVFCVDIDHAERMRQALINLNADLAAQNSKYIMQITGDNDEGKRELDNFINPEETYPVIATTSELMTTGVDAQTCKVIVLDANISSMTKFKQIIGRGTRIREDYGKMFFTILDFRNATDLFADPQFDGEAIRVKPVSEDTDLTGIIDEEENCPNRDLPDLQDYPDYNVEVFENKVCEPPKPYVTTPLKEKRQKVVVNGVDVSILIIRELHFDKNGKPITISLKDYTRELIQGKYASLDDFINHWNESDRKEAIINELETQGIPVSVLYEVNNDNADNEVDLFDLICHIAYDQPPLTRRERANNVKKRNIFAKYSEQARKILEALLDKYADQGIENIENPRVLTIPPINEFGSVTEIIKAFGSKENYEKAIKELENELYKTAA
jgi:type I restriction enzyme R subunit